MRRSVIIGCGAYLPERILTNAELAGFVDTSDEWIVQRSGIRQRHVAAEGELTSDLAIHAARAALDKAGLTGADIDLIILATSTPDRSFPATAVRVQAEIGMHHGAAFDVQAVCSGFVYAMSLADAMLKTGQAHRALVIGAETFTRLLDWSDRTSCVLFGDGAGAVILESQDGTGTLADRGIHSSHIHSDGRFQDILQADGGVSLNQKAGAVRMQGKEVFRHAVTRMAGAADEILTTNAITLNEIDWLVPHQANTRILEAAAKQLGLSQDKVVITVDRHGNTSAASIPLALAVAEADGRLKPGHLIILEALGAGLTWGACLLRW